MKPRDVLAFVAILLPFFSHSQTGTSCTDLIPIIMDGVTRNYTISSATGGNMVCTSNGTTPVTYFSIVSNASAQRMTLRITGGAGPIEVGFYDGTSCTNGNFESESSICFYDGKGVWAPAWDFVITPNKTYIIRIKTVSTGTLQIAGQYYTAPNNSCATATPIGTGLLMDNNAAHMPATDITAASMCAPELDNTAFYVYTVETSGNSGVLIEVMDPDNNYQSNLLNLGFQSALFTGTCGSLTQRDCNTGVFSGAQLWAGILPAGTKVYFAIDGILGTNCDYAIRAINAVILSVTLRSFTISKIGEENVLKWVSMEEKDNAFFEIERSIDGTSFRNIGRLAGQGNSSAEKQYEFSDRLPPVKGFYRLKMITTDGRYSYSDVLRVDRKSKLNSHVKFNNIVSDRLSLQINDLTQEKISISIIDRSGREVFHQNAKINPGSNLINIPAAHVANGVYYLVITADGYKEAFSFLKN